MLSRRFAVRRIFAIVLSLLFASALLKPILMLSEGPTLRVGLGTDTRADALLAGCVVALLLSFAPFGSLTRLTAFTRPVLIALLPALGGVVLLRHGNEPWLGYGGLTLVALAIALLILHLMISPQGKLASILSWTPLVKVGVISYGLYLWHNPLFLMVGTSGWTDWGMQLVRAALTLFFTLVSFRYIECPALRLKNWQRKRTPLLPLPTFPNAQPVPEGDARPQLGDRPAVADLAT